MARDLPSGNHFLTLEKFVETLIEYSLFKNLWKGIYPVSRDVPCLYLWKLIFQASIWQSCFNWRGINHVIYADYVDQGIDGDLLPAKSMSGFFQPKLGVIIGTSANWD